jgi:hypothetical protein
VSSKPPFDSRRSARSAEQRARGREANRRFRAAHGDEIRERHRCRMESDPDYRERIRASRRRYGAAHREELRERHRRRMESDPDYRERYREAQRRYRAAHKAQRAERRRFKRRNDPVYRERQLELERFWRRRMYFREVYGITLEDYDIMLARQNGACAICSRIPDKRLAVDHCHTSGKVRGLLCAKCNSGLAFYEDNPRYLLAAVSYLQASRSDEE